MCRESEEERVKERDKTTCRACSSQLSRLSSKVCYTFILKLGKTSYSIVLRTTCVGSGKGIKGGVGGSLKY